MKCILKTLVNRLLPAILACSFFPAEEVIAHSAPNHAAPSDCDQCHTGKTPVPGNAELRPCSRPGQPRGEQLSEGKETPRVVILDELQNLYLPVPFDHTGHAEMAKMGGGCAVCHHYTPTGSEHPACKTCHEVGKNSDIAKPGLKGAYHRQCLSCHREWSGESGCSACHQPKTGGKSANGTIPSVDDIVGRMHPPIPEPEQEQYVTRYPEGGQTRVLFRHREHIRRYGLKCAECHHEDNCGNCHQQGKQHVQKVRTVEEHHKPCMSCHTNDTCESCHYSAPAGPPPPFDHSSTGWPLKPYHAGAGCRGCHPSIPFVRLDSSCNACHKNWKSPGFQHAVTGQALDEAHAKVDCAACHKELAFGKPPTCDECHDEAESITFPARRPGPVVEIAGD